ncbi:MAG TPA: hypothetical protein VIO12_09310 [Thermoanaerobaculia bacterium]
MARRGQKKPATAKSSRVARARKAVSRIAKKLTSRVRSMKSRAAAPAATPRQASKAAKPKAARAPRRSTGIPIDALNPTYSPTQASLKSPFRITGDERQRDQEIASGYADERWNEEDRLTNKSGDPRIGTHGRRYEPNE